MRKSRQAQQKASTTEIERDFRCDKHGDFSVVCDKLTDDLWSQPCPKCGTACENAPRKVVFGAPYVQGDVRRPYWSDDKQMYVTSKHDLREFYKRTNTRPLSDADIKVAREKIQQKETEHARKSKLREARREREAKMTLGNEFGGIEGTIGGHTHVTRR